MFDRNLIVKKLWTNPFKEQRTRKHFKNVLSPTRWTINSQPDYGVVNQNAVFSPKINRNFPIREYDFWDTYFATIWTQNLHFFCQNQPQKSIHIKRI